MTRFRTYLQAGLVLGVIAAGFWLRLPPGSVSSQADDPHPLISVSGHIVDAQDQPVAEADIKVFVDNQSEPVGEIESQENGVFIADLPMLPQDALHIRVERAHFQTHVYDFDAGTIARLRDGIHVRLPDIVLSREITLGFWVATFAFLGILVLIALEKLHNTTATFLGVAVLLVFSYLGVWVFGEKAFIFTFEQAVGYIDFEVLLLVMSMMIVVGILENTGVFQWLAFVSYRLSRGHISVLVVILLTITALASAMLDNVTTMLLMAPISLQIALALSIDPLALLIPEVLASNVGGLSTLIGTPTNILIGSYAGMGFNDFLFSLTPGVVLSLVALMIYVVRYYRTEYRKHDPGISPALYAKLEENARIHDPNTLRKSLIVFGAMLMLFLFGDFLHLEPVIIAIAGAAVFLVWVERDVEKMLMAVDWTTLVFFMMLFIAVGAIQEVGVISVVSEALASMIGDNLLLGLLLMTWAPALLSLFVDDIPVTAAMLPIIGYLAANLDPTGSNVLYFGFAVGAAMGGNGSLIGAAPNLVAAGIAERAGFRITYRRFMRAGLPSMLLTITVALLWLILRFFILV